MGSVERVEGVDVVSEGYVGKRIDVGPGEYGGGGAGNRDD